MDFRYRKPVSKEKEDSLPPPLQPRRGGAGHYASRAVVAVLVTWILIIHYFERTRVKWAMDACQWEKWEKWDRHNDVKPHRIAFIADPQLVDDHTYPNLPGVVSGILRGLSDNYLHINNRFMQRYLDPDTTIFLGDLFDGGREWEDSAWMQEYERFNRIFPKRPNRRQIRSLPGNHDIGFESISVHNQNRFSTFFGEANDFYELGNHTIIQLDTISLSHANESVHADARRFLETVEHRISPTMPRIILSHVPLYRDPKVEVCGPLRESKRPFPLMKGLQYQTVIDYSISVDILKRLEPKLVFSGDDHDYCDVRHVDYSDNSVVLAREISCKTASMTNGIKHPAYQLLSLRNPLPNKASADDSTINTHMCMLPSPYGGIKAYVVFFVVSAGILAGVTVWPEVVDFYIERGKSGVLPLAREFRPQPQRRWRAWWSQVWGSAVFAVMVHWFYSQV